MCFAVLLMYRGKWKHKSQQFYISIVAIMPLIWLWGGGTPSCQLSLLLCPEPFCCNSRIVKAKKLFFWTLFGVDTVVCKHCAQRDGLWLQRHYSSAHLVLLETLNELNKLTDLSCLVTSELDSQFDQEPPRKKAAGLYSDLDDITNFSLPSNKHCLHMQPDALLCDLTKQNRLKTFTDITYF